MQPIMTITGRLGTEVEMRETRNKVPFARFRLAHTPRVLQAGGWVDGETLWLSVRAYRRLGENACASLRKGEPVVVTGRVHHESWVDDNGVLYEQLVLEASSIGHDLSFGEAMFRRSVVKNQAEDATDRDAEQPEGAATAGQTDTCENSETAAQTTADAAPAADLDEELKTLAEEGAAVTG